MGNIKLIIDDDVLSKYEEHYFSIHTRAKNKPIKQPYHESINTWMIMKRPAMNALKGKWKEFITWFIEDQGFSNLRISHCDLEFTAYYSTHRRHDPDNSTPKFILDGLVESGFITDDDSNVIHKLTLMCDVDEDRPRTEIYVKNITIEEKE